MISSLKRGHKIIFIDNKWVYEDTKELIKVQRPCIKCNKMPTTEGHDACVGKLKNVTSACCGHGIEKGYIINDTTTV